MANVQAKVIVNPLPLHVAIIMDGNGRWAKARNLPRTLGHREGAEAVREAIKGCIELGIPYLTLYAFSSENWNRPVEEVNDLMGLLHFYLGRELKQLHKNNIRIAVIGDRSRLAPDIRAAIEEAEELTQGNTVLHLNVALSYGSRQEIVAAAGLLAARVQKGELPLSAINEEALGRCLYTHAMPDPDLLIRTGGEKRLSNFLLWQSAYAELYFTDILWPDFTIAHLKGAVEEFQQRERRYGTA